MFDQTRILEPVHLENSKIFRSMDQMDFPLKTGAAKGLTAESVFNAVSHALLMSKVTQSSKH